MAFESDYEDVKGEELLPLFNSHINDNERMKVVYKEGESDTNLAVLPVRHVNEVIFESDDEEVEKSSILPELKKIFNSSIFASLSVSLFGKVDYFGDYNSTNTP